MNTEEIIKSIEDMSVIQLSQLIKALEEKFGVSAAMAAPVAASAGPGHCACLRRYPAGKRLEKATTVKPHVEWKSAPSSILSDFAA